jgi:hypothetical protein
MSLLTLHAAILKQAGFHVVQETSTTASSGKRLSASLGAQVGSIGARLEGGRQSKQASHVTRRPLEFDIEDANDVIAALREVGFQKIIILEDFHYLPVETQKSFSIALKAYHEASDLCFMIVGVWLEGNRLLVYNGDLAGRMTAINADQWTEDSLTEVIEAGEEFLNIQFDRHLKESIVDQCFNSVYILQEVCAHVCSVEAIKKTQRKTRVVGELLNASRLTDAVISQQDGRYYAFLHDFAIGFRETELEMYKWILNAVLLYPNQKYMHLNRIQDLIRMYHPLGMRIRTANIVQALQSVSSLQDLKGIRPIVLDYDRSSKRLYIVDRGFLIWRYRRPQEELFEAIGL